MIDKLVLKLQARDALDESEVEALREAILPPRDIPADEVFIREGVELHESTLLLEGFACRFKDLADGGRQITAVHVPGDFVDLHSFTLKKLDHSILAITPCKIAPAPHDRLREITERRPHLTRMLWFSTNLDAAMHREWELSLGRRDALARTAHLFCELHTRLQIIGLAEEARFALTLTQQDLSECLGLTPVHVNRVLRQLRERELITFRAGEVIVHNRAALEHLAEFDRAYLYLDRQPR